jgi:RimJ/RimL family protein N-acetyltransferase
MEIETKRLLLRELVADDLEAMLAYRADPRYGEYYAPDDVLPDRTHDLLQMFLARQKEEPRTKFQLAVILKSDNHLIGNCGIRMKSTDAIDGDIGYELSPDHWGQGYTTEAAQAIVKFGFSELNLHRIWSWCIADNHWSVRVLEKLGMRQEGRLRENEYFKGRWWDTLVFAILDYEWRAGVGNQFTHGAT